MGFVRLSVNLYQALGIGISLPALISTVLIYLFRVLSMEVQYKNTGVIFESLYLQYIQLY